MTCMTHLLNHFGYTFCHMLVRGARFLHLLSGAALGVIANFDCKHATLRRVLGTQPVNNGCDPMQISGVVHRHEQTCAILVEKFFGNSSQAVLLFSAIRFFKQHPCLHVYEKHHVHESAYMHPALAKRCCKILDEVLHNPVTDEFASS